MSWLSFLGSDATETELPDIFPIPIKEDTFVNIDVLSIYTRILKDTLERTHGIPDGLDHMLWDNCMANERQEGLVTLLAKAMLNKTELFLVYRRDLKLIRPATQEEQQQIRDDYSKRNESKVGVYITFKNYTTTDMVKFYSQLEYCSVGGLWKQGGISKAIQFKFTDLRASTGLNDKAAVKTQAQAMAKGLQYGKDIMMDAKDVVETAKPDLTATKANIDFIAQKRSFYLGMPASYLSGEQSGGLGDSGKADTKAVDRGLKAYYFSITKPVLQGLFGLSENSISFKEEDPETLSTGLETLKTMDTTSDEYLSKKNKTLVVNKAFGFDEDQKGDPPAEVPPPTDKNIPNEKPVPPPKA